VTGCSGMRTLTTNSGHDGPIFPFIAR